jgi:hypothetical protein
VLRTACSARIDSGSVRSVCVRGRAAFEGRVPPEVSRVRALQYLEFAADVADEKAGIVDGFEHRLTPMGRGLLVQNVASLLNKGVLSFFARTIQKF